MQMRRSRNRPCSAQAQSGKNLEILARQHRQPPLVGQIPPGVVGSKSPTPMNVR
jgi:hypothetical protein